MGIFLFVLLLIGLWLVFAQPSGSLNFLSSGGVSDGAGGVIALPPGSVSSAGPKLGPTVAKEGEKFTTPPGGMSVQFGAGDKWNEKWVTGEVMCDVGTFGDPIYGTVKTCRQIIY